ncbi:choline monooxygenase [Lipingzhangella halophila]|uniref:Choline monooxygenase n=1 Tax=Lipingzhangella halophila TaxID=1783352 RepID=A0A7W7RFZ3_9ACTN|nr:aromatic ring-hydroxylating dioxygenase subunit alpha [Lipingzhangella halophila]MBB4931262.1 choline monooxygenase [Lipingzhangella halophila]
MSTTDGAGTYGAPPPRPTAAEVFTDERTYRSSRVPVDFATTLIPAAYTSQEFFDIERERVFATSWIAVGTTCQVETPGQVILADVAGRSLIVTRNNQGELRAFHNFCRHRATKLLDGVCTVGRTRRIRCPYHSWTYDLDGNCLGTPLFEGSDIPEDQQGVFDMSDVKGFDKADYGLLPVRVDSWGFLVFVNLDPQAAPLSHQLGDLPERLAEHQLPQWRARRRQRYDVAANYKLIGENFMEYYHLPWVHPELIKVSRLADHYRWQGPGMYTGMCTSPISRDTEAGGWGGLPPMEGLSAENANAGRFVWLFPNTALVVLPNHAFALFSRPEGPGRTVEEAVIVTHPDSVRGDDADEGLDQLEHFWDLVNRQDLEIVERVQQGIANPAYPGGRMCYRFEEPLHRFQNMIIDRMIGIDRVPAGDEETMTPMFVTGHE